jgi:hypothetical protein
MAHKIFRGFGWVAPLPTDNNVQGEVVMIKLPGPGVKEIDTIIAGYYQVTNQGTGGSAQFGTYYWNMGRLIVILDDVDETVLFDSDGAMLQGSGKANLNRSSILLNTPVTAPAGNPLVLNFKHFEIESGRVCTVVLTKPWNFYQDVSQSPNPQPHLTVLGRVKFPTGDPGKDQVSTYHLR